MLSHNVLHFIGYIDNSVNYNYGDVALDYKTGKIYLYNGIEWLSLEAVDSLNRKENYNLFNLYDKSCSHCGASSYSIIKMNAHRYTKCDYCGTIYALEEAR